MRSRRQQGMPQPAARVFWLMFSINAVNFLDRFIVIAVGPALKREFNLHDRDIGLLSTAFILVYTLAALPLGLLADRSSRTRVIAWGVGLWSVMSTATAFVWNFGGLFLTRAAVGVGEASYYPAGSALLGAYFPYKQRARVMSRWQAGQMVGVALAFAISALLYRWLGGGAWRAAFLITGLPGLVLAFLIRRVRDAPAVPTGKDSDADTGAAANGLVAERELPPGALEQIRAVLRIRTVWLLILLQSFVFTVATPAITFLPIYLVSRHSPFHISAAQASLIAGVVTVLGGLSGILLGGALADRLSRRMPGGRVMTAAVGFALALPCYAVMLLTSSLPVFVVAGLLSALALNLQAGPLTAAVQDATPPALRATAVATILLFGHLLGDVWAPTAVGAISTALHERTGTALLIVGIPALFVATILAALGSRIYAAEVHSEPHL